MLTLLHNYGFEIRLNIKTVINAYVCFRMKTVMKSPYSLHSKRIKRLPLGCIKDLYIQILGCIIRILECFDLVFKIGQIMKYCTVYLKAVFILTGETVEQSIYTSYLNYENCSEKAISSAFQNDKMFDTSMYRSSGK